MKALLVVLIAVVAAAVVGLPAAASTASAGAARYPTIFVGARDGWVASGVSVAAGATISVRAAGQAFGIGPINPFTTPSDWARGSGPGGQAFNCQPFSDNLGPHPCLLDNAPYQALVAKVGDDGPPFYIGDADDITVPTAASGSLYLGVNDNIPYFDDNGGGYAVQIR